jgi:hypothetical protein
MSANKKIRQKIESEEVEYSRLEEIKQNTAVLSEEKTAFMEMEKKRAYIDGMKAALEIIEN